MIEADNICNKTTLKLKGGLYTLTTIQLFNTDLAALDQQLQDKVKQAPNFFKQAPIVLDLQFLSSKHEIDFPKIQDILEKNHLILVAIRHAASAIVDLALKAGLPILRDKDIERPSAKKNQPSQTQKKSLTSPVANQENPSTDAAMPIPKSARLIKEPIRSGQQIYARGTDLVVTAPVSQGAEILADGHIHVYAPLRGRALAGISGDVNAQIFCTSLEAELVSIAGQYKVSEDFEKNHWQKPVAIALQQDNLHIRIL